MTEATPNEAAIAQWSRFPRSAMEAMEPDGDLAKRHLVNPVIFRMLGEVTGRRILDAGCGTGYLSRLLAARGAHVTGAEPAAALLSYARELEAERKQGVEYLQAELAALPGSVSEFDAVVCSMVLMAIPDWKPAMRACVRAVRPGGLFVFAIVHPAFEQLRPTWNEYGEYRLRRYLAEYDIPQTLATDYHRPISTYLNELAALGCRIVEIAEPGLDPEVVRADPILESYVHLPNFLLVAAEAPVRRK